jgi:hypothetical protein
MVCLFHNFCCIIQPMIRVIRVLLPILCSILSLEPIAAAQSNETANRHAARAASDSFIADLVANRVSEAIEKANRLDPTAPSQATHQYTLVLDRCGRPLDSKIENDGIPGIGHEIHPDRSVSDILIFQYLCKTTRHSDWIFSVLVQATEDSKYEVSVWGCGKAKPQH